MVEQKLRELGIAPLYGEYHPLSPGEIREVEQLVGFSLPDDYKEFISKYGCAYFADKRVVVRTVEPPPEDLSDSDWLDFAVFFGGCEQYCLVDEIRLVRGRMPDTVIPIADDHGGNLFCLGVGGDDRNKVYIWDFHNEPDAQDYLDEGLPVPDRLMYSNMGLVAHSFTDFILQMEIRDVEPEE
ncbi:MAG TPA: SMI1/KNR4 family protein [Gemmataceae bacterium]|nr:SMI1/KNR4 family protein [Gemmataceae bacterium]